MSEPIYVSKEVYDDLLEFCDKTYGKTFNPMRKPKCSACGRPTVRGFRATHITLTENGDLSINKPEKCPECNP